MNKPFRIRKNSPPRGILIVSSSVILILILMLAIYQLDRTLVPFRSENPLWHEVTVNQPVLDGWVYAGEDEEGYLKFSKQGEPTNILPANSRLLALDGNFVVIESHTPNSLTYAEPFDAIPSSWILCGIGALLMGGGIVFLRLRSRDKRVKLARISPRLTLLVSRKSNTSRFRPSRKGRK